jgi:hypothetical protein
MHHTDRNAHRNGFTCAPARAPARRTFNGLRLVVRLVIICAALVAVRYLIGA